MSPRADRRERPDLWFLPTLLAPPRPGQPTEAIEPEVLRTVLGSLADQYGQYYNVTPHRDQTITFTWIKGPDAAEVLHYDRLGRIDMMERREPVDDRLRITRDRYYFDAQNRLDTVVTTVEAAGEDDAITQEKYIYQDSNSQEYTVQ